MTKEEIRFQVAISCIQGVLEAKHGIIGEIVPAIAVKESLRIADEFVKQWEVEEHGGSLVKEDLSIIQDKLHEIEGLAVGKEGWEEIKKRIDEIKNYLKK